MTPQRRDQPPLVVVHAGFHKTGTSSAQGFLAANRPFMTPRAALVLPGKLRDTVSGVAVRYSRAPSPALLDEFQRALRRVLSDIDLGLKRNVVIADENLCGQMPGRDGQIGYPAAPALMAATAAAIRAAWGADADVAFLLTTRNRNDWLRSCWMHNLRQSRLTQDFQQFGAAQGQAADLLATLSDIRQAVAPDPVYAVALEDVSDCREGPARPILDMLDHPTHLRAKMVPATRINASPDAEFAIDLLNLNRSDLDDASLALRKARILYGSALEQDGAGSR